MKWLMVFDLPVSPGKSNIIPSVSSVSRMTPAKVGGVGGENKRSA